MLRSRRWRGILAAVLFILAAGIWYQFHRASHQLRTVWVSGELPIDVRAQLMPLPDGAVILRSGRWLFAWDADGSQLWQQFLGSAWPDCHWAFSPQAGLLLFDNANHLRCLDPLDGSLIWERVIEAGGPASRRGSRLVTSPDGSLIALANSDHTVLLDSSGEALQSMDYSALEGEIRSLYAEDSGRLTICMKSDGPQGTLFSYYRPAGEEFAPVPPFGPGISNTATQLDNGLFYTDSRDSTSFRQMISLSDAEGSLLFNKTTQGTVFHGKGRERWLAWVDTGMSHSGDVACSIGLLDMDSLAFRSVDPGDFRPVDILSIAPDGGLLLEGVPADNSSLALARRNTLQPLSNRLQATNPALAEWLNPRRLLDRNTLLYISPDGRRRLCHAGKDVYIRRLPSNAARWNEFGTVYGLEFELDEQGNPRTPDAKMRLHRLQLPLAGNNGQ